MTVTRAEKLFFIVICASAIAIAIPGFFAPAGLASGLSWLELPPLHARFVAAIYLFGTITMLAALLVPQWTQIRTILLMVAIFTGLLFITSLLNLQSFDFSKPVVWLWFVTYFSYPLIALILLWIRIKGSANVMPDATTIPTWMRVFLLVQGLAISIAAMALLVFPNAMIALWPWKITPLLAQFYSGPLLAYGIGSLIFSRQSTLSDLKVIVPAMLGFTACTLIASIIHSNLFSFAELTDVLWFVIFAVSTLLLLFVWGFALRGSQSVDRYNP